MRKLFIIGLMAWVFLTGCTFNVGDFGSVGSIDEEYRFKDYAEFNQVKGDISSDYFIVERNEIIDEKDVDSLRLETIFEDIHFIYEDRDSVEIKYFGIFSDKSTNKEPEYTVDIKGDVTFVVKWEKIVGKNHALLEVYLPNSLKEDMDIETVSGQLKSDKLLSKVLDIDTVSGDLDIDTIEADELLIGTVSGDMTFDSVVVNYYKTNSVSGDTNIESLKSGNVDLDTTSGEFNVRSADIEDFNADTVSGDVQLSIKEQRGDYSIGSVSGSVKLNVEALDAKLDLRSTSGDIKSGATLSNIEINKEHKLRGQAGNGEYDIDVRTVSGDIRIN